MSTRTPGCADTVAACMALCRYFCGGIPPVQLHPAYLASHRAMSRHTRSGAELSPYLLQWPIKCEVDIVDLLHLQFAKLDAHADVDTSDTKLEPLPTHTNPPAPTPAYRPYSPPYPLCTQTPPSCHAVPLHPSLPSTHRNTCQKGSHARHCGKRAMDIATLSTEKPVHAKHCAQAATRTIPVDYDATDLPPGWRYVPQPAEGGAVPIVDCNHCMLVLVGGSPHDIQRWQEEVVAPLEAAIVDGMADLSFSPQQLHHTRGSGFAALASGPSHGGGEKHPGNRVLSKPERAFMDGLLQHPAMRRTSGFMNHMCPMLC
ncbi:hypothetical protein BDP27DRAFT_1440608 [Rhodocollybia butyracea]|uniref:Uncharacterized protein n=1 Tax=Rhodocollybia butyracea TaxID=206335 RepID=A0A9P5NZR4_9AGAR|nr:hypothetical protein BDP27DRAFT_1440608 [Rhodocollybia butyracea]